jgi:hypothetical protein
MHLRFSGVAAKEPNDDAAVLCVRASWGPAPEEPGSSR